MICKGIIFSILSKTLKVINLLHVKSNKYFHLAQTFIKLFKVAGNIIQTFTDIKFILKTNCTYWFPDQIKSREITIQFPIYIKRSYYRLAGIISNFLLAVQLIHLSPTKTIFNIKLLSFLLFNK